MDYQKEVWWGFGSNLWLLIGWIGGISECDPEHWF